MTLENIDSSHSQKRFLTDQSLRDERSFEKKKSLESISKIEKKADALIEENRDSEDKKRLHEWTTTEDLKNERKTQDLILENERTEKESVTKTTSDKGRRSTDKNLLSERDYSDTLAQSDTVLLLKEKTSHDITRLAEQKYRGLLESAHDAIIVIGNSGTIEFCNKQVSQWFGYTNEELIGRSIELLVPERFEGLHVKQRDDYLTNPTPRPMGRKGLDLKGRRKDGSEFPIDIALSPSGEGDQTCVTAIIRDTTERHRLEVQDQFLSNAGRLLAASLEKEETFSQAASLITSEIADGCVLLLLNEKNQLQERAVSHRNPVKQELLEGLTKSVVKANDWPLDPSRILLLVEPDERSLSSFNLLLGTTTIVSIPLMIQGRLRGVLSLFMDESKRKIDESFFAFFESIGTLVTLSIENARLYAEAQRAIKVREDILSVVSHDLKNPLTTISMIGQLLLRIPQTDQSRLVQYSKNLKSCTDQMHRMIEDLMDFSKIQLGKLSIEKTLQSPASLIEMVYEMMKDSAEEKELEFTFELTPELPALHFDKQRMAQALMNLVGNAIKFTDTGKVVLSAKETPEGVCFSVSDNGPGIPEESFNKIFDWYWQAKETKALSVGLGLSITKGIVEAHNGSIRVESQLGDGSVFSITLPV